VSCASGVLVKSDRRGVDLVACRCRSWFCPPCAGQRRRKVQNDILSGSPMSFMTLTWATRRNLPPDAARSEMGLAWKRLVARIKRKWPGQEFEYAVVVEKTKRGFPHLHIAFRGPYIPQNWLSDVWCALLGACIVDIQTCRSQSDVAGYLAKYLSKDPTKLGTGKRYWFSQGYRPAEEDQEPDARPRASWKWENNHIAQIVADLSERGLIPIWLNPEHCVLYRAQAP